MFSSCLEVCLVVLVCCSVQQICGLNDCDSITEVYAILCPGVDICNANASSPDLQPNEILDGMNRISCCQGCSCHPDCKQNCCFQDDTYQPMCTHMRIEPSNQPLGADVPAYNTISTKPSGGCIDTQPFKTLSGETLVPSCGLEAEVTLGALIPVLSKTTERIYKNEACARCHGVLDSESFTPHLVCDAKRSITEYLQVVENDNHLTYCSLEFRHNASTILRKERCLVNPTSTCLSEDFPPIDGISLTTDMIKSACVNGYYAPIVQENVGYKNVFCAHCSSGNKFRFFKCTEDFMYERSIDLTKLNLLLDPRNLGNSPTSRKEQISYPTACLKKGTSWDESSCRRVLCASGMIRNEKGDCIYSTTAWITEGFSVIVKLAPISVDRIELPVDPGDMLIDLIDKCPWPFEWEPVSFFIKERDGLRKTDGIIIVNIISMVDANPPKPFVNAIGEALSKSWHAELNGSRIYFRQALLEYSIVSNGTIRIPDWKYEVMTDTNNAYKDEESALWRRVMSKTAHPTTTALDKLVFCEQVDLREEEYISEVDHYRIRNKLTGRSMFGLEFILVKDGSGSTFARVCLSDTPLVVKASACSGKLATVYCVWVWALLYTLFNIH